MVFVYRSELTENIWQSHWLWCVLNCLNLRVCSEVYVNCVVKGLYYFVNQPTEAQLQ